MATPATPLVDSNSPPVNPVVAIGSVTKNMDHGRGQRTGACVMPPYAAPPPPPSPPSPLAQHARGASCDEDVQAWEWNCVDSGAQDMQLLTMSCTHHIYVGNLPISSRTGHTCMYITNKGAPVVATAAWSKALGSSGRAGRVEHQSHHAHAHASHESWDGRPMSLATTTTISTPNAGSMGARHTTRAMRCAPSPCQRRATCSVFRARRCAWRGCRYPICDGSRRLQIPWRCAAFHTQSWGRRPRHGNGTVHRGPPPHRPPRPHSTRHHPCRNPPLPGRLSRM